ncbi:hypothetical protein A2U01_0057069, partial [Trifolium medium]|nr:hypothetical protein [Trifolium medium]
IITLWNKQSFGVIVRIASASTAAIAKEHMETNARLKLYSRKLCSSVT